MAELALRIRNLSITFSGFKAIDGVDLDIQKGELRAIIGPNGAGKTTLMDIITGKSIPSTGTIDYMGKSMLGKSVPSIAEKYGIARKFQNPNVFGRLTVYDNLYVAVKGNKTIAKTLSFGFKLGKKKSVKKYIRDILEQVNLAEYEDVPASYLSHGQKQWLEIGMLLAQQAELLIFDEPTAGMTADETYKTGELIKKLAGTHTILAVEHDMAFVKQIADKVTVLNQGRVLAEGSYEEIEKDPKVIQVYLKEDYDE